MSYPCYPCPQLSMRPLKCFMPRLIPTVCSWRLLCERVCICLNLFHKQSCFGLKKAWDIYESWQQTVGVIVSVCLVLGVRVCVSLVVVKNNRAQLSQSQTSVMVPAEYLFSISARLYVAPTSLRCLWGLNDKTCLNLNIDWTSQLNSQFSWKWFWFCMNSENCGWFKRHMDPYFFHFGSDTNSSRSEKQEIMLTGKIPSWKPFQKWLLKVWLS